MSPWVLVALVAISAVITLAPKQVGDVLGEGAGKAVATLMEFGFSFFRSMCISFGRAIVGNKFTDNQCGWIGFIALLEIFYWLNRATSPRFNITPSGVSLSMSPFGQGRYSASMPLGPQPEPRQRGRQPKKPYYEEEYRGPKPSERRREAPEIAEALTRPVTIPVPETKPVSYERPKKEEKTKYEQHLLALPSPRAIEMPAPEEEKPLLALPIPRVIELPPPREEKKKKSKFDTKLVGGETYSPGRK